MNFKNLVFYCPSRNIGGNELLFVRLARYLSSAAERYHVYYIDYPDGFSHSYLDTCAVNYIEKYCCGEVTIPEESIVIIQLNFISQLSSFKYNRANTLFLFWCLHRKNISDQICRKSIKFLFKQELKRLGNEIRVLSALGIIRYMSQLAYNDLISDYSIEPRLVISPLPNVVPIENSIAPCFGKPAQENWRFCWLGRLDKELSRNLLSYMNDLERLSAFYPVSLTVIGSGTEDNSLKRRAKSYTYKIEFLGEMRDRVLDDAISNVDVGLAVGTSAYEFSLRGKPTIVSWSQDKVYKAGERCDYSFVYQFEQKSEDIPNSRPFNEIFSCLINNYEEISKASYDFVLRKSPEACSKILLRDIETLGKLDFYNVYNHIDGASGLIERARKRITVLAKIKCLIHK